MMAVYDDRFSCHLVNVARFWFAFAVAFSLNVAVAWGKLGGYQGKIDPKGVTVTGFSAGGYFAPQFHVAYSSIIQGVATFAGGPYLCAWPGKYNLLKVLRCSTFNWSFFGSAGREVKYARQLEALGVIDPLKNLADDRVFVYHSIVDPFMLYPVSKVLLDFYRTFVPNEDSVFHQNKIFSTHGFPTVNNGFPCYSIPWPNFLLNCGYNGAFEALNFLYEGSLNPPSEEDVHQNVYRGDIARFDQSKYTPPDRTPASIGMADEGYLYIPKNCQTTESVCKLNIVFHGCIQGSYKIGRDMVEYAGFAQVADANNLVVLFPQVTKTKKPHNPAACWDWYGYVNLDRRYPIKSAPQMVTVFNMIENLMST